MATRILSRAVIRGTFLFAGIGAALVAPASPAQATYYSISGSVPDVANDGRCSVREAFQAIQLRTKVDTCAAGEMWFNEIDITGDPAKSVTLTQDKPIDVTSGTVVLNGSPATGFYQKLIGNKSYFVVHPGAQLQTQDLNFTQFKIAPFWVQSGDVPGQGFVRGLLTMFEGEMSYCTPNGLDQTAGIMNIGGQVDLYSMSIHHITGAIKGGAVYNQGLLSVSNSTMYANSVSQYGGAINSVGSSDVSLTVVNSTISGNSAKYGGGGIAVGSGVADIRWTTITNNAVTGTGSGVRGGRGVLILGGVLTSGNNLISDNTGFDDCKGAVTSVGYNLFGNCPGATGGPGDIKNAAASVNSLFIPTGSQWQQTPYHLPKSYSSAVNSVPNSACASAPSDQIGNRRPAVSGTNCDIGSIEVQ